MKMMNRHTQQYGYQQNYSRNGLNSTYPSYQQPQNYTPKKLNQINIKESPEIFFPEEVLQKIRVICSKINKEEWSAILFFKETEGNIDDPGNLKLEAVDLWPMAKGQAASVDFEYGEDWIDVYDTKEHLEECKIGIIHSHVNMSVYHSSTDMADLNKNCANYEYYLSVVTNNNLDFQANIARKGERRYKKTQEAPSYWYRNALGKKISKIIGEPKIEEVVEEVMFLYEVEIFIPAEKTTEDTVLLARIEQLLTKAKTITTPALSPSKTYKEWETDDWIDRRVENKEEPKDEYEVIAELITETVEALWRKVGEKEDINLVFEAYLEMPRSNKEMEDDASKFMAYFIKNVEADAKLEEIEEVEQTIYIYNTISTFMEYIDEIDYSPMKQIIINEIESTLQTI